MSLFFRRARGQLTGLLASCVDDTLAYVDSSFSQLTEETRKGFEVKSREYDNMHFSGAYIDRSGNSFNIYQCPYIDRQKPLPSDANFGLLRQYHAQLSLPIHCLSDVCVVASKLTQITKKSLTYRMWSNAILQYSTYRIRAICLSVCANLIPRVTTYAPVLPTLATRYSLATSFHWHTSTIMAVSCTTQATTVAELHDP